MLRVTDGRVFDGDRELTELTAAQLDRLVADLYPCEPALRDERTMRHRATSYSGCFYDVSNEPSPVYVTGTCEDDCAIGERVYSMGGPRLHALWLTGFRFDLAAAELGVRESALRRWFCRWRAESPATPRRCGGSCPMDRRQGYDRRRSMALLSDGLQDYDRTWYLCRRTGRSYGDLVATAASVSGDRRSFLRAIGYSPTANGGWCLWDDGWWPVLCAWLKMYVPQFEEGVRSYVSDENQNKLAVMDPDAQARVLEAASKALNIAPEVLTHFVAHREEIELFLEAARSTLGTLAESKLWELVMSGDAATIRWLLPRIKGDVFGDRLPGGIVQTGGEDKAPRTIRIIDIEDV
jgi:hypothetical protein